MTNTNSFITLYPFSIVFYLFTLFFIQMCLINPYAVFLENTTTLGFNLTVLLKNTISFNEDSSETKGKVQILVTFCLIPQHLELCTVSLRVAWVLALCSMGSDSHRGNRAGLQSQRNTESQNG